MSNMKISHSAFAVHPGYYVAEIVEDMGISQAEFATRMGTTPKTISELVNGKCRLTYDLAQKLSIMLGGSVETWVNIQNAYDRDILEVEYEKKLEAQKSVMEQIDYAYFVMVGKLPKVKDVYEKIKYLCSYLKVADLRVLQRMDFLVNFRSGVKNPKEKNIINAQAWIQTAINFASEIETKDFSADMLKRYLPEIRSMTLQEPEVFLPRLRVIFSDCGVAFVMLPHLKNSGVHGAVKWLDSNHVILAINDRRCYADTFWFSLFHEIRHVLQRKVKTVFVSYDQDVMEKIDAELEKDADDFAQNYLVPENDYRKWSPTPYTTDAEIVAFAKSIGIHPGVVAGRLQHDQIIPQSRCVNLKQKYKIIVQ